MLIVKPGFQTFSLAYGFVLAGTSLNGLAFVLTKFLERRDSPLTVMLWLNMITVLCFSPGLHGVPEVPPSPWLIGLLVLGPIGQYLGILALRRADAATLAPMNYARLILAGVAAFLIFGERPDVASILGATVIFASCLPAMRPGAGQA